MKKYIYLLILAGLWFHFYHIGEMNPIGAGVTSVGEPYQGSSSMESIEIDSFEIIPRKSFDVEARIIDAEHYYLDRKAWLSPMDIVIGWNNLSDESVYQLVDFSLSDRQYSWKNNSPTVDNDEIKRSTANISIIPADNTIADQLDMLKIGQVVQLQGHLVDVERTMHWKWKTSLSREDSGAKAGEVLFLESLEIVEPTLSNY